MSIPLQDDHFRICIDACALEDPVAVQRRHRPDKITLLGHLLESQPNNLIVFPEAQPPPALRDDAQVGAQEITEDWMAAHRRRL